MDCTTVGLVTPSGQVPNCGSAAPAHQRSRSARSQHVARRRATKPTASMRAGTSTTCMGHCAQQQHSAGMTEPLTTSQNSRLQQPARWWGNTPVTFSLSIRRLALVLPYKSPSISPKSRCLIWPSAGDREGPGDQCCCPTTQQHAGRRRGGGGGGARPGQHRPRPQALTPSQRQRAVARDDKGQGEVGRGCPSEGHVLLQLHHRVAGCSGGGGHGEGIQQLLWGADGHH